MSERPILSLFDYSGAWSDPYRARGYDVIQVDIKHGLDVYSLDIDSLPRIHGILAAPPCTDFASSGAAWFAGKDKRGDTFGSKALIYRTLEIIWRLRERDDVAWWALENPVGRLASEVPELKPYGPFYFDPCDYGDPYTKRTGLWGVFVPPLPLFLGEDRSVGPVEGSKMHTRYGGKSERTKAARSVTPQGFARAFFDCNP